MVICVYQRDYILRLIEQLGQFVARLLEVAAHKPEEAVRLCDQAYQRAVGVGSAAASRLEPDELLGLLPDEGGRDPRLIALLARLLVTDADLHEFAGKPEEAFRRHRLALGALARLAALGAEPEPELAAEVGAFLWEEGLDPDLALELVAVHEAAGSFADAEDALFAALEADPDHIGQAGVALYGRLLALDDNRLVAGGLSRAEVVASLAELQARTG